MNATAKQLDRMMEAMQRVEQDLRDYRWMSEKVAIYKKKYEEQNIVIGTPKYGIEATLPKTLDVSDTTFREVQKLLRIRERKDRYEQKLKKIEKAVASLTDERERAVAEGLMDGERLYMIAQQLNVTRQTVYELKKSTIRKLAIEMYGDEFTT